ncbi:MAG: pyridoxal phosphate-dependent aminotransferase [Oscillibacter sp.]|jgi:aspartate/methionine/tyrosine aminotransferase|nr:pyridoxal phosphate-dependent aminotransferase [Oscillibacter sp.]
MELTLNRAALGVETSGIRRFTALTRATPGACSLTIGEPDLDSPGSVREAVKAALDAGDTHYPPGNGYPYLLEALSQYEETSHSLHYSPDEIIVTVGATEGVFIALSAILNPGDEVIIPTPAFSLYGSATELCRGVPVALPTQAHDFQIAPSELAAAITPKTKALVLTSPNNPTGRVYTKETLDAVHEILRDQPIFVLCDDVYRELIYTEDYRSFAGFTDMRDRLIVINSFSKPWAMTGWRLGWCMADKPVKERMQLFHQYAVVSVPSFVQRACVTALACGTAPTVELFRRRRDYVCKRLAAMGLEFHKPEGAFYVFPSIQKYSADSESFCKTMLREGLVGVLPGVYFGTEGYMRLSYCYSDGDLKEGLDRIERFLKTL